MPPTDKLREEWNKFVIGNCFAGGTFQDNDMQKMYTAGYKDGTNQCKAISADWWLAKLNEALLSERTRLEGLMSTLERLKEEKMCSCETGLPPCFCAAVAYNETLREVRQALFGNKTP